MVICELYVTFKEKKGHIWSDGWESGKEWAGHSQSAAVTVENVEEMVSSVLNFLR